jgi:hypothetical protein
MNENTGEKDTNQINFYGKVAKFPKGVYAHQAYAFLENIKVSKGKLWYILVQKQDDKLQCVKYNRYAELDLHSIVEALKEHYMSPAVGLTEEQLEAVGAIVLEGEDKFVTVRNIPKIEIGGKMLVAKITEDIIRLLAA